VPTLMVLQGPDKGRRFRTVEGKTLLLGRSGPDMNLSDYTVSRRHAEVRPSGRGWCLDDLKSSNGTYLNGKHLEGPSRLKHGDLIRMGSTVLIWDGSADQLLGGDENTTTVAADIVDLDTGGHRFDASIIGSVAANDDSMILATPAAAEAVRSWRVVSSLLQAVAAVDSPHQLVQRVIDLVFEEVPADRGFILMKDEKSGKFETEAVRQPPDPKDKIRASRTIIDHVISNREGILCSNAMSDARFAGGATSDSIHAMGLQSVICVPMIAREEVLGVIYVDCAMAKHVYTEEQLRLVASIAQMSALAIEDARLVKERVRTERLAAAGETVAALSHYIKNILQGMKGGSDVVTLGLRGGNLNTVEQGWQIVDRNLDKIYSLTMNMLAFAKRREPRLAPVQLRSLVQDVLKLVQRRADDKGVQLNNELSDTMPPVVVDENGIHQVIMNIVVNAIDAVEKTTGVVNVKADFDPVLQAAVLTVGDNGPGIPEDAREKVFDAFYSTKGHGGTGLGLAVAKKIVDEHLGKIEITSVVDHGTLIRVILPADPKKRLHSDGTHGPAMPGDTHGPILPGDDN
jgi:two-component system, NtrC family, sensor kinase